MELNRNLTAIKPSPTLSMSAKAAALKAQGKDVLNLSVGEPDFDTPSFIIEAAYEAMKKGQTRYTAVDGTPSLKKAIIEKFQRENGLTYTADQIVVSSGGKHLIYNALMATLNTGDEVIVPAPFWVSYPDMVVLAGGTPVIVPCPEPQGFKLTPTALREAITPKTKWLILNGPSNPTGAAYTKEELQELGEVLSHYPHVYILSDDIYEHLLYDNKTFYTLAQVAPSLQDNILTMNGVSKAYAMTGWRIGYGAGPRPLMKAMAMLQSQSTSNPCSISQAAAEAALQGDQSFLTEWKSIFQKRRDLLVGLMNDIPGLSCSVPDGAFYVYVCCEGLLGQETPQGGVLKTDTDVVNYFLEDALIAAVPGEAFGLSPYLRLSYATSEDVLKETAIRMKKAVYGLKKS